MRVIVMGGAGDMGSRAVEDLAAEADVERVTIADRDHAGAARLAARLAGARAEVVPAVVDALDHRAIVQAMASHDVVASALGPFHRFEVRLAAAAIEAGVDYASVCDDYDAAEAVFTAHDRRARDAGRIVLTGLGTSPGITNVGVRFLADRLDWVRRVDVQVYQPLDAGGGEAVIRHMLHIMTGDIAVWRGGARRMVRALSESRTVAFPRFGPIRLWNMGHAEPVTVPRFIDGVEDVSFFMGYGRGAGWLVQPARLGLFRARAMEELAARLLLALERSSGDRPAADGAVRVDVAGDKDGRPLELMVCGIGGMREATGLALAIDTLMLARRQLRTDRGGVYAPEAALEPAPFIGALRAHGIEAYEDLEMSRPVAPARDG